jgi:GH25 family lysozyme M1 (1,4-beta-N-acetylmuramidase)
MARMVDGALSRWLMKEQQMPKGLNAVVDLSHHNGNVDFAKLKAAGILGVIHKATQGTNGVDPTYAKHRAAAQAVGLLWGAYHFGTDSDGVQQAENFLSVVGDPAGMLLALDFESNPTGPSMSLEEARAFVTHVKEATGRFPGFYSGHDIKQALGTSTDPVLSKCWFWLAQYGPTAVVPPNWSTWTMWQYTDGALGPDPKEIAGVGRFDREVFNGTADELQAFWGN